MKNEQYLAWVDAKILELQTEIARLTVARSVIEEMPAFTAAKKPRAVAAHRSSSPPRSVVRLQIISYLRENGPTKPIMMMRAFNVATDRHTKKPYYNAISNMLKEGQLLRGPGSVYMLPPHDKSLAAALSAA